MENKVISIVSGGFDPVHPGHIMMMNDCLGFSDYLVGDLVAELKKQGLYENSIIVIWGDHGWQLGEHSFWAKHTNFDIALRVPLIIKPQEGKNMKAAKADGFAEIVDIFPTLCDLAGLEGPSQLQGQSLVPVLKDPNFSTKEAII